jgi:hypothetical protein
MILAGLRGVFPLAGTTAQRRRRGLVFGQYGDSRIYLFPVPEERVIGGWQVPRNSAELEGLRRLGATVGLPGRRGVHVLFDHEALRRFYLYDVLLHELGHHVEREGSDRGAERYARWFAEFRYCTLRQAGSSSANDPGEVIRDTRPAIQNISANNLRRR